MYSVWFHTNLKINKKPAFEPRRIFCTNFVQENSIICLCFGRFGLNKNVYETNYRYNAIYRQEPINKPSAYRRWALSVSFCLCFLLLFLVCVLGVVWWAACFFVRLPLTQVGVLVINAWPYPVKRDRILYSVVQTCDAWPNPEKAWHSPVWRNLILHDLILKAWSNPLDLIMQNVTRSCSAWPNHVKRGINVSY